MTEQIVWGIILLVAILLANLDKGEEFSDDV
jgi:hypothetical protein